MAQLLYRSNKKCHAQYVPPANPAKLPHDLNARPHGLKLRVGATTPLRYRLVVLASSATDVVESTGGWLFDRVLAGWHVHVLVDDDADVSSLQILGVTVGRLNTLPALLETAQPNDEHAHAVAVASDLFAENDVVHAAITRAAQRTHIEVTVWGDSTPTAELGHHLQPAHHRLSTAARAFKSRALDAARVTHSGVAHVEHFACTSTRHAPDDRDLTSGICMNPVTLTRVGSRR